MKRVLISKAIKEETIFMIDNNSKEFSQPYYNSINGRIKFLDFKKIKLSEYKLEETYPNELLQNPIACLRLEYVNLNHNENNIEIFENNCNLVDLDEYSFKVFSTKGYGHGMEKEIYEIFNLPVESFYGENDFIPKIKQTIELFFVVPDEDTDYYFEIINGKIEEL